MASVGQRSVACAIRPGKSSTVTPSVMKATSFIYRVAPMPSRQASHVAPIRGISAQSGVAGAATTVLISSRKVRSHMPTGPKGQKHPADVIGNAVRVMRIATGEEPDKFRSTAATRLQNAIRGRQATREECKVPRYSPAI